VVQIRGAGRNQAPEERVEIGVACIRADLEDSASFVDEYEYCTDCNANFGTTTIVKTEKIFCFFDFERSVQAGLARVGRTRVDCSNPWREGGEKEVSRSRIVVQRKGDLLSDPSHITMKQAR